jgi:Protein of unknown function (DUF1566)
MKRRRVFAGTIGALVLGGVLVASYGASYGQGVAKGGSKPPMQNPLTVIITKLDQILAALTGGGGEGNHTLRWDTNNPSATRFTVLAAIPGAVLDNNTGLVWEQAPDGTRGHNLLSAAQHCVRNTVGGTRGWRLPSVVELKSVQDGSPGAVGPFVPEPFFTISTSDTIPGVQSGFFSVYWSATTDGLTPANAWLMNFGSGVVFTDNKQTEAYRAWCVRGGMHADVY